MSLTSRTMLLALLVAGPVAAATHTVAIEGTAFVPATLRVARGDRIVWVNKDPFPHTVTATDRSFDSGPLAPGKHWSLVATRPGGLDYLCTLHTTMQGHLEVQ